MSDVAAEVIVKRHNANPYRKPFLVLVFAISLSLITQAVASLLIFSVAHDTNELVTAEDIRNSPESREAQRVLLDQVIQRVDCNSRKAIEDALNSISSQSGGVVGSIDITNELCPEPTTTTTSP